MVNVTIEVEGVVEDGQQLAESIEEWAKRHPGTEQLVIQMQQTQNGGVFRAAPTFWPTGVAATIESFERLGTVVGEHALAYDVQYQPNDGSMGFGVAAGYVSPIPGFDNATFAQERPRAFEGLRLYLRAPRLNLLDAIALIALTLILRSL